jgi:hypothetical protein
VRSTGSTEPIVNVRCPRCSVMCWRLCAPPPVEGPCGSVSVTENTGPSVLGIGLLPTCSRNNFASSIAAPA